MLNENETKLSNFTWQLYNLVFNTIQLMQTDPQLCGYTSVGVHCKKGSQHTKQHICKLRNRAHNPSLQKSCFFPPAPLVNESESVFLAFYFK